eukprot:TRINITY_DN5803_c0_g1_i1.p1 TRINITY_DN5803_c0_g1~~TRINITY_DN5803_c0_g1_i1.p1  ORF type:complete len:677 (+),score=172.86 TRINITY_DN5803_c0_g1_i1:116-2146(+)
MEYFRIACQGAFKADRGQLLVGSVHDVVRRQDADIVFVSSDGDIIPTHRSVLGLYSRTLPEVVESVPCCHQNVAVSVPFPAKTISSLLKLMTLGESDPVDQMSLASLTECAQVLGIALHGLEIVERKNVVTLQVGEGKNLKKSLTVNGRAVSPADLRKKAAKISAPPSAAPQSVPADQKTNNAVNGAKSSGAAVKSQTLKISKEFAVEPSSATAAAIPPPFAAATATASITNRSYSEDDIIEITEEMYAASAAAHNTDNIAADEEQDDDECGDVGDDDDIMPHHFLMQGTAESAAYPGHVWNSSKDENNWDIQNPKGMDETHSPAPNDVQTSPEVQEVPNPEDPNTQVYTCSFCPGQYFKKRNDINRHLKKHVPIEMRKRFQCQGCKEKFINNSNLKVHLKVCTGKVREFLCKKCGDIQYNKTDHLDHMARAHNVTKKHACPICHKQLKKTSDLKKHMSTHSNQKPFACEVCGKKFKTESYVKVHLKAHFPDGKIPEHLLATVMAPSLTSSPSKGEAAPPVEEEGEESNPASSPQAPKNDLQNSPRSEDPRSEGFQDSDVDTDKKMNGDDNNTDDSDKENHLIVDEKEDGGDDAMMEYDDVTDSPAVEPKPDEQMEEDDIDAGQVNGAKIDAGENGAKNDEESSDVEKRKELCSDYPKKDSYVTQISMLRNSSEMV